MAKMYYDKDANLAVLKGKKIAIIGYGIQGRAQSLNLRDSGCDVVVSELAGTPSFKQAKKDGFEAVGAAEASKIGSVIQILTQDHVQALVYEKDIRPNLKTGKALLFSHGFNIHYGQIVPPPDIDVLMVAPKGPGSLLRRTYEEGQGTPGLLALHQDYTKKAKAIGLAYARAIGCTRAGVIETTFREETETDLFGEQAVLCGGLSELIRAGFDTLVEAGYQPEMAYFECCHETKLIMDLIYEDGIGGMRRRVSDTAEYGDLTRGRRVVTEQTREEMRRILREVQDGSFAREWVLENQARRPVYHALRAKDEAHLIEKVGKKLRDMMSWISKK